jgi:hypothetical protein
LFCRLKNDSEATGSACPSNPHGHVNESSRRIVASRSPHSGLTIPDGTEEIMKLIIGYEMADMSADA